MDKPQCTLAKTAQQDKRDTILFLESPPLLLICNSSWRCARFGLLSTPQEACYIVCAVCSLPVAPVPPRHISVTPLRFKTCEGAACVIVRKTFCDAVSVFLVPPFAKTTSGVTLSGGARCELLASGAAVRPHISTAPAPKVVNASMRDQTGYRSVCLFTSTGIPRNCGSCLPSSSGPSPLSTTGVGDDR